MTDDTKAERITRDINDRPLDPDTAAVFNEMRDSLEDASSGKKGETA